MAIDRALITKPAIVLADEPTGNLDSKTSAEVLGLIKRTSAEFRQPVVMITHNDDIARLADRIIRIEDGRIVAVSYTHLDVYKRQGLASTMTSASIIFCRMSAISSLWTQAPPWVLQ